MLQKSSSQLGLHPKSTFSHSRTSKHPLSVLLLNPSSSIGPLQDSVNFQKSPSLSPTPISSHHNLPKSKSTATLNQQRKPQRIAEPSLSHQNSRRSLGGTPQSYSLLMDYINECKVNTQSHDNSFEHNEHLFSNRKVITENRVVDPEILQLIMNGETEKIFKESRNSLKENSPQSPSVPLIRKKSTERESNKPISGLANREISPVQKKANKSASKRPMSYNETTMRELLKLSACSSPNKPTKQDSKTKLLNDPAKKVPVFFFNIPEDPADVQKTLTTEDNAAPTFTLKKKSQSPKTKKKSSPGKKRSDLTIVSNAMKQYEMFMEGEYTMSLESKRRSSPSKSQNSVESKLHSVEVSTISREDSLRTGVTEREEMRYSHETGERLLSELLTDYSPALQTSPNDLPRRVSSFNPQHSQNDPRKSPLQPKVIPRVISHSQIRNSTDRVNSAARTRNSEFSFEMTYFKPIEDSKLDEYIQSVNGSRGQTTTTSAINSPETSPPKYTPGNIENYQELEKTLSYWQNLCKDINKTPSKTPQPQIKMKMGPQNPVIDLRTPKPTRSISNQKPRAPTPTIKSATTVAKNMVKQTLAHQLNLSPLSKTPSKARLSTENKSPVTRKNSRERSTSIESKKVYENKSVVVSTRPSSKSTITRASNVKKEEERTYFKLDQLLQVIKTNNTTGTTKDDSRTNSETTSEIGLFQQNTFRSKDIVYVNLTPSKRVYGKNLISNSGTNR